jgi:NAD-dependent SIR2 family protein deacetylase
MDIEDGGYRRWGVDVELCEMRGNSKEVIEIHGDCAYVTVIDKCSGAKYEGYLKLKGKQNG